MLPILRSGALKKSSGLLLCTYKQPLLINKTNTRNFYIKEAPPKRHWSKTEIDEAVLDMLYENTECSRDVVSLEANFVRDLLLGKQARFGIQWDMQRLFQLCVGTHRQYTRDFQSGREVADWVQTQLDEYQRLKL